MRTPAQIKQSIQATKLAAEKITPEHWGINQFWGVGPTKAHDVTGPYDAWKRHFSQLDQLSHSFKSSLPTEEQSMHRGPTGLKVFKDYMSTLHTYMGLHEKQQIGFTLGGGHGAFAACVNAVIDPEHKVFLDIKDPRGKEVDHSTGHFRNEWAQTIIDIYTKAGKAGNLEFSDANGVIPETQTLIDKGIKYVITVGNETTNGSVLSDVSLTNLNAFLKAGKENQVIMDFTSLLGSKKIEDELLHQLTILTPAQKVLNGPADLSIVAFPERLIEQVDGKLPKNLAHDSHTLLRMLAIDKATGNVSMKKSPFFNAETQHIGPVINTFNTMAMQQALHNLKRLPGIDEMIDRTNKNLAIIKTWTEQNSTPFKMAIADPERQSPSVALLEINDTDLKTDSQRNDVAKLIRQYLGDNHYTYAPDIKIGEKTQKALNVAQFLGTYPGTPGHLRFWIGGVREPKEVEQLTDWIGYAFHHAKANVLGDPEEIASITPLNEIKIAAPEKRTVAITAKASKKEMPPTEITVDTAHIASILAKDPIAIGALKDILAAVLTIEHDVAGKTDQKSKILHSKTLAEMTMPAATLFKALEPTFQVSQHGRCNSI